MKSAVHVFDGYVATQGRVRARCSCGFLTTPQAAQRPARQQLAAGHGLSELRCEACGRGSEPRPGGGLPPDLTVQADPVAGHDRLVCAQGSGGCDLTSGIGAHAAGQVHDATGTVAAGVYRQVADHQAATLSTAVGVLMGRGGVDQRRAQVRLARRAAHLGISELEAANRIVAAASTTRRRMTVT